jgi:hypothetical protein
MSIEIECLGVKARDIDFPSSIGDIDKISNIGKQIIDVFRVCGMD